MSEPKLNFNSMPEKSSGNNVEAGMNDLIITKAVKALSKAKKQMLVITVGVIEHEKFTIDDYYTLFGTEAEGFPVEEFGQFKLRTLQEVTHTIPEGDFSIDLIAKMLVGKKFRAELIIEPYQGKDYLKVGFPETFEEYIEAPVKEKEETPADAATVDEVPKTVKNALENDDEI